MQKKSAWLIILMAFAIAGCKPKIDYSYLMRHPELLEKEFNACRNKNAKTSEEQVQCDMVAYAAANFSSMLIEQQQDPQGFGQRIMDAQIASMKAKEEFQREEAAFNALKTKNTTSAEIAAAQEKVDQAKQSYQQKAETVKVMLAVLSLTRPE